MKRSQLWMLGSLALATAAEAAPSWRAREAREIVTATAGAPRPTGVAHHAALDRLVVLDDQGVALRLDRFARVEASARLEDRALAARATLDAGGRRLVAVDDTRNEAVIVPLDEHGLPAGAARRVKLPFVGPLRVAGVALGDDGTLYALDRLGRRIHAYTRAQWTGAESAARRAASIELADVGPGELRGLAHDPASGRFYTLVFPAATLAAFDPSGALVARADAAALRLVDPAGMAIAPSGDQTDDPEVTSLYVADRAHAAGRGAVIEIRLGAAGRVVAPPAPGGGLGTSATVPGTLVRTTQTSRWSSPSPDPAGVLFDPSRNQLLVTDSEIEEMSMFAGVNAYEVSLTGQLLATGSTMRFTTEATDVTRDPANGKIFVSDDDRQSVYVVDLGADGRFGTSDDSWTTIDTDRFDSGDPEGLAYDPLTRTLFIADGVNEEVYVVRPGADGRHGTSDDVVTRFDTGGLGVEDPEGVAFDPQRGTLFLIGDDELVETTLTGSVVNRVSTSVSLGSAGGIAIGPHSSGNGARSFYLVCREEAFRNDGLLLEITSSLLGEWSGDTTGVVTPPPPPPPPAGGAFPVLASSDDAEQRSSGSVTTSSSDLEMTTDGAEVQTIGLRFTNVTVAPGAAIAQAWIQFTADESHSARCSLRIAGHAADNPPTFGSSSNVTSRPRTAASATWLPAAWVRDDAAAAQKTPDLTAIVQELVSRPGWASGNAMAFVITGTGVRNAVAYDGDPFGAPVLHVKINLPPVVSAGADQTIDQSAAAALAGSATDDGLLGPLLASWSTVSGPGAAVFADPAALATTATFPAAGVYALELAVSDGGVTSRDTTVVTVTPPNQPPAVEAGPGREIELPATASLAGVVTDDGKPGTGVTQTWTRASGPGTVTFANPGAAATTASFSLAGTYLLRLTASDGALTASDSVQVIVHAANQPPVVNAGGDFAITLPAIAPLAGLASDPDAKPGPFTTVWSKRSGPGTVTFADAAAPATTATFSLDGVYVLRLTASDGALAAHDEVEVRVQPPPFSGTLTRRVAASADDAEQYGSGSVTLTSSDLEMVMDGTRQQIVGIRFRNLTIPNGAPILDAWIQFTADVAHSGGTVLTIQGQASDDAAAFTTASGNVTSRPRTASAASWTPAAWTRGAAGAAQRTPSLVPVVQEIVSRPGWLSGNAMAFFVSGSGVRSGVAYDGEPLEAAVLHVAVGDGTGATPVNAPPVVDAGAAQSITLPAAASLDGTVTDDGRLFAAPTLQWTKESGPGTVTFGAANAADTPAEFSAAGVYLLRLTAHDGEHERSDTVTVAVSASGGGTGGTGGGSLTTIERRVATAKDDAEESAAGSMNINSSRLEMVYAGNNQLVGYRFQNLTIPRGATIRNAWVQFTVDASHSGAVALRIQGEAADQPTEFLTALKISTRPRTAASVSWSPPAWTEAAGTAGPGQRTPDLSPILQELVNRPGWASGNPIVLVVTGTGVRAAAAYNRAPARAALLHVEYE